MFLCDSCPDILFSPSNDFLILFSMGIVFIFAYLTGKEEGMVSFIFHKIAYSRCVCGIIAN